MKLIKTALLTAAGVLIFDCCILVFANICIGALCGPMPVITLYDRAEVSGSVVSISDVCAWEHHPGMYITAASWQDGDPEMPVISDDHQSVSVGDKCGVLEISVAESPDVIVPENTVTVIVGRQP